MNQKKVGGWWQNPFRATGKKPTVFFCHGAKWTSQPSAVRFDVCPLSHVAMAPDRELVPPRSQRKLIFQMPSLQCHVSVRKGKLRFGLSEPRSQEVQCLVVGAFHSVLRSDRSCVSAFAVRHPFFFFENVCLGQRLLLNFWGMLNGR